MLENGGESNPAIISICMKCTVVAHWPNVLFGSRVFSRVLGCGAPRGSPGRPATSFLDPPRVNIGHASSSFLRATWVLVFDGKIRMGFQKLPKTSPHVPSIQSFELRAVQ